jgi:hypothetical protein
MRNSLALLGIPDLPIRAFRHVGDRRIQPQGGVSSVVESVSHVVSDVGSSVTESLADVDDTVNQEIPGGWATVASIAVPVAAPYVQATQAAVALDKGASLEDVAKNYAISQVAGQVGSAVGAQTGSNLAGNVAGGTTGGLLSGATPEQALTGGLTSGAISQVTPSGLLSQSTSDLTPKTVDTTSTTPTTGATNMADNFDYSQIYDYGYVPESNPIYDYGYVPESNPIYDYGDVPTDYLSSLDAATQAAIKRALAAGGSAAQGAMNFLSQKGIVQGGLQTAGGLLQMQQSREAALQAQRNIEQAAGRGVAGAQFRPIGTTTRFGTSNFQVDPLTGQVISAGYTVAPEITSAQNRLLGLGASYLAQSPEEVAQQYMSKQYDLLDPSRQRQLAGIRNQQFQTGRGGLSVGSTGLRPSGAQGLMGSNPELEAYYNALAQQDAQLAAQAQQAGQQQVTFGTGLFGQAGQLENMAQQPFALSQGLAGQSSVAGARAGEIGLRGAVYGGALGTSAGATASPLAYGLSGLGNPNSLLGGALGTYLTSPLVNTGGAGGGITSPLMQNPTLDVYGSGYVPLGYANF